ncbi:MAG TPA: hypothetical protein VHX37_05260 [Acidobacteriaceae bacterium]|nr:hypothetical protein [Acidobacteriaceae bacterium]
MRHIPTRQLTLALSVTAAMVLAATVVLWGSEYKCSLYHGHPAQHARVAVAKLRSEKERPMAMRSTRRIQAPLPQAVFFALGGVLLSGLSRTPHADFDRPALTAPIELAGRRIPCLIHFSFRPPPALGA